MCPVTATHDKEPPPTHHLSHPTRPRNPSPHKYSGVDRSLGSKARDQTNTQSHSLCAATARSRFGLPQLGVVMSTTNSTTDLPVAMTGAAGCPLLRPEHSTVLGERNFHTYEQEQLHQDFSLVVTYAGPRRRFSPQDITAAIVGASPLIPANAFRVNLLYPKMHFCSCLIMSRGRSMCALWVKYMYEARPSYCRRGLVTTAPRWCNTVIA